MLFKNKTALLTGGITTINQNIITWLAREGACILLPYSNESQQEAACQLANEISWDGGEAQTFMAVPPAGASSRELILSTDPMGRKIDMLIYNSSVHFLAEASMPGSERLPELRTFRPPVTISTGKSSDRP